MIIIKRNDLEHRVVVFLVYFEIILRGKYGHGWAQHWTGKKLENKKLCQAALAAAHISLFNEVFHLHDSSWAKSQRPFSLLFKKFVVVGCGPAEWDWLNIWRKIKHLKDNKKEEAFFGGLKCQSLLFAGFLWLFVSTTISSCSLQH